MNVDLKQLKYILDSFYIPPTAITGAVRGNVSDWNQPTYYQTNSIIPNGSLTKYSNGETFDAWCADISINSVGTFNKLWWT